MGASHWPFKPPCAGGQKLRKDAIPLESLLILPTSATPSGILKPSKHHSQLPQRLRSQSEPSSSCDVPEGSKMIDKSVNTDLMQTELRELTEKVAVLENEVKTLTEEHDCMQFS